MKILAVLFSLFTPAFAGDFNKPVCPPPFARAFVGFQYDPAADCGFEPTADPDHDPRNRRPPPSATTPVPNCVVEGVLLNQRGPALETLLDFLSRSAAAAEDVAGFRADLAAGTVKVEQITDELRRRAGAGVVASYQYIPGQHSQTVFVDLSSELGVLAVQLYHEIVHSQDPSLPAFYDEFDRRWPEIQARIRAVFEVVARRVGRPLNTISYSDFLPEDWARLRRAKSFENDNLYRIEHLAFSRQMAFLEEMTRRSSCLGPGTTPGQIPEEPLSYVDAHSRANRLNLWIHDIPWHLEYRYGLTPPTGS